MVFDFAYSRIFVVSKNEILSQKIISLLPQEFEINNFKDWRACFQSLYHQPEVIFLEMTGDIAIENSFLEKMMAFNSSLPIILIKIGENISCKSFLEKKNVMACFEINELNSGVLFYFLKNIKKSQELEIKVKKLVTQLEMKTSLEKSLSVENATQEVKNTPNDFFGKEVTFEEYKHRIIHHYLEKYDGDIMMVSNKLDIGKSTIYRMLKSEKEKKKRRYYYFLAVNWFV